MAAHQTAELPTAEWAGPPPEWRRLVDASGSGASVRGRPPLMRRVLARFVVANLLVVALLLGGS